MARSANPSWSLQDAKNRFSEVVNAARKRPQTVTKHGKDTVVIVDAQEYERLKKTENSKKMTFAEMLLAIPKGDEEIFERMPSKLRDFDF